MAKKNATRGTPPSTAAAGAPRSDGEIAANLIGHFAAGLAGGDMTVGEVDEIAVALEGVADEAVAQLTAMLKSNDATVRQMATLLSVELCDDRMLKPLRSALLSRQIPDEERASFARAMAELGAPVDDETYRSALSDPAALLRRSEGRLMEDAAVPELAHMLVIAMQEMPPEAVASYIRDGIVPQVDRRVLPLLTALVYFEDDEVVLAAIEALERVKEPGLVPLLQERARFDPSQAVQQAADKAALRLEARTANQQPQPWLEPSPLPLVSCELSTIDGDGTQVLFVARRTREGRLATAGWFFSDLEGLTGCFQSTMDEATLRRMKAEFQPSELAVVPLEMARQEIERAFQCAVGAGRRPPPSHMLWYTWLEGEEPAQPEFFAVPRLNPSRQARLLRQSPELLELGEFASWYFAEDDLALFRPRYERLRRRGQAHSGHRLYEALLDLVVDTLMSEGFRYRQLLPDRLRRQAWLLTQLYEEDDLPLQALAAAAAFECDDLHSHPLLRGMVHLSFLSLEGVDQPDDDDGDDERD